MDTTSWPYRSSHASDAKLIIHQMVHSPNITLPIYFSTLARNIYFSLTVCEDCNEVYHGDCPVHGPLGKLDVSAGQDQDSVMFTTVPVPSEATIKMSAIPEAGLGVFAKKLIPRHTRVGPYEGKRLSVEDMDMVDDTSYIWEVSYLFCKKIPLSNFLKC